MQVSRGILTARGGMTSHAAVVARGMGRTCVAGCGALAIDYAGERFAVTAPDGEQVTVRLGDTISIDAKKRAITLEISGAEMKRRRKAWKKPKPRYTSGVLAKYASQVSSASLGAVTDAALDL